MYPEGKDEHPDLEPEFETKPKPKRPPLTSKNLVIAYTNKRWSMTQCAKKFGKTNQFIAGCLFAWGIPDYTGRVINRGNRGRKKKIDYAELYELHHKKGLSTRALGRRFNVSHGTVARALKLEAERRGEEPRTISEGLSLYHHRRKIQNLK